GRGSRGVPLRPWNSGVSVHHGNAGDGAGREVQVGARRRPREVRVASTAVVAHIRSSRTRPARFERAGIFRVIGGVMSRRVVLSTAALAASFAVGATLPTV